MPRAAETAGADQPVREADMDIVQLNMFDGKVCTKCKEWKLNTAFNSRPDNGKLRPWCVECNRKYKFKLRDRKRDDVNKNRREYYRLNRQDIRSKQKAAYDADPVKFRAFQHKTRVRRQCSVVGSYTTEHWNMLCKWFGNVCLSCDQAKSLTVDHVIPIFHGGANTIDNLQPLCESCNKSKSIKRTDYRDPTRLTSFLEHIQCLEVIDNSQILLVDIH